MRPQPNNADATVVLCRGGLENQIEGLGPFQTAAPRYPSHFQEVRLNSSVRDHNNCRCLVLPILITIQ